MLTATRPQLSINRIGKHLGAEISGIDLSLPLDDATFEAGYSSSTCARKAACRGTPRS